MVVQVVMEAEDNLAHGEDSINKEDINQSLVSI